jgi:hypothetical protein
MGNKNKETCTTKISSRFPVNMAPQNRNFTYFFKNLQKSRDHETHYI